MNKEQISHAYIIVGEDTNAVRGYALDFAKALNCESENAPCNTCLSCRVFDSGNHPDTIFVTGSKQKGIGVDDVRQQVLLPMAAKPFKYRYKIFIVENAEALLPAAQNALLKTIEEPAPYGVFLFLAPSTHSFLPTMLSRCVLRRVDSAAVSAATIPTSLAEEIANCAENADITEAFALYDRVKDLNKTHLLDMLYIIFGEKIRKAASIGQAPEQNWLNATAAITRTKRILSQNGNERLALELMFLDCRV